MSEGYNHFKLLPRSVHKKRITLAVSIPLPIPQWCQGRSQHAGEEESIKARGKVSKTVSIPWSSCICPLQCAGGGHCKCFFWLAQWWALRFPIYLPITKKKHVWTKFHIQKFCIGVGSMNDCFGKTNLNLFRHCIHKVIYWKSIILNRWVPASLEEGTRVLHIYLDFSKF